jgi:hypothetical protein
MQGTTDSAGDSNSAAVSNGIRIDRVLLLTGTLGLSYLFICWFSAIYVLVTALGGAYLAIAGNMRLRDVVVTISIMIVYVLMWSIARWIARGLLEGRKAPAIVACILMIGYAAFLIMLISGDLIMLISGDSKPASVLGAETLAGLVAFALAALVFSLLLIASFRNRLYWGGAR